MEKHKRKAFMICPVRNDPAGELSKKYVEDLERQGWEVHWPHRDTCQLDNAYEICLTNLNAIRRANRVFVVWDGESQGVLFDLGVAFANLKPITWLKLPERTIGKSFENMVRAWEDRAWEEW